MPSHICPISNPFDGAISPESSFGKLLYTNHTLAFRFSSKALRLPLSHPHPRCTLPGSSNFNQREFISKTWSRVLTEIRHLTQFDRHVSFPVEGVADFCRSNEDDPRKCAFTRCQSKQRLFLNLSTCGLHLAATHQCDLFYSVCKIKGRFAQLLQPKLPVPCRRCSVLHFHHRTLNILEPPRPVPLLLLVL